MCLFAALSLAVLLAPVHAQTSARDVSTFKNGANRFSLRYPSAWDVSEGGDPSTCFFAMSGTASGSGQALSLTCESDPLDMRALFAELETQGGVDAFVHEIVVGSDGTMDVIDYERARIAGRVALKLRYVQTLEMEDGAVPFYSVMHLFSSPTVSYTLVCGETDGDRVATDALCEHLARSFSLGSGRAVPVGKPYRPPAGGGSG